MKERAGAEALLTSIDQEGGRVRRLRESFTTVPPMRAVGQADDEKLTYEIGKLLIYDFLASAQRQKGEAFSLRAFHDLLWQNGHVPITLQRWKYLGLKDQVEAVDRLQ